MVVCDNVGKVYDSRRGHVEALAGVDLELRPAEFVSLIGPSGCGKSTLLRLLAGLEAPSSGAIRYAGGAGRPHNALVFQELALLPWLSVIDNVAFGLEAQGMPKAERHARAADALAQFGLGQFGRHFPHELSVGMRQRAALARALLRDPLLLLMDEPFSAVDAQSRLVLQEELLRIWKDHQKTVVFVTHDIEEAVLLGDRVVVMTGRPGRIRASVEVPLPRPRDLRDRQRAEVVELAWQLWKSIESEVRQSLELAH
jgi:NitT/TauT family transport system ATP-binding protein